MRENPLQHLRSMSAQGPTGSGFPEEGPLNRESSVLVLDVLDRIPSGYELQGLSKPSMYLVRARIDDETVSSPGQDVEISSGSIGSLSEIRFKDLTVESSSRKSKRCRSLQCSLKAQRSSFFSPIFSSFSLFFKRKDRTL